MEGKETLHQRLEILEQSGLIEKHTTEQTDKIIGLLYGKGHEPDMEKMETFITHIAMAMQRIQNSEYEQPLAKEVLEDLKTEAFYEEAKKAYAVVATTEKAFYSCLILQKGCI